jgi:pyridoxine 5-phosphate synthase
MTAKLSVNINKIATLRNSRGCDVPNLVKVALDCENFGAEGITVHPRPDERHITYQDVYDLKSVIKTEFNIEGNPKSVNDFTKKSFVDLVKEVKPTQVTLVPDAHNALTSNSGWDTIANFDYLVDVISDFKSEGIRTSIFIGTNLKMIEKAKEIGTDRIEFYTEPYASGYPADREKAIAEFVTAAKLANELGLEINAGHDLSLENLKFFAENIPNLKEVSIGHALMSDALYLGLSNVVPMYKNLLK